MEYFLGSLVTFALVAVMGYRFKREKQNYKTFTYLKYSQSYAHDLMMPFLPTNKELALLEHRPTQSSRHDLGSQIRVLMLKDNAYWIKDNAFYIADVKEGAVLKETTRKVDTMGMDRVQLDRMTFIVEQLTKGIKNDSSNTGQ